MDRQQREMALLQAAFDGNLRLLKKMARGLDDSGQGEAVVLAAVAQGSTGNRALHLAAMEGRMDVCRYLVGDLRLDVNQRNHTGDTPLFFSAFFGRAATAKYLVDYGADPTLIGHTGSPLHGAAGKGQCEIVQLLLSRGVDVDWNSPCGTPLHVACAHGQAGTMKILLDHHADPNKVLGLDDTPLALAIRRSVPTLECVKLLIKAGADVNFIDSNGATYVMMAADLGLPGILKCLLDAGTNPNIPDGFGRIAIEIAALRGREFVEMLFPLTSPISTVTDWSIDGIISHIKSRGLKPMDKQQCEKRRAELKIQATQAFRRNEYLLAGELYSSAMELSSTADDDYATLLANRSLCLLRLGSGNLALSDANMCRTLRPGWSKACYRQGSAFMLLKDYSKAHQAFADGLKLEPKNVELQKASREALEAMENARTSS